MPRVQRAAQREEKNARVPSKESVEFGHAGRCSRVFGIPQRP